MARPRKPTKILELNGAFKNHPKRGRARANEPVPNGPLGEAPSYLRGREKALWSELASIVPSGVLTIADRWLVEVACGLIYKRRRFGIGGRDGVTTGELSQLIQCLARMGMTPADRSKISVPKAPDTSNPFTQLANEAAQTTKRVN